jgi:hypothetical protein
MSSTPLLEGLSHRHGPGALRGRGRRALRGPPARTCVVVAVMCVGVGAARPAPLVLGLALVVLLGVPWGLAVAHRLSHEEESAVAEGSAAEHQDDNRR